MKLNLLLFLNIFYCRHHNVKGLIVTLKDFKELNLLYERLVLFVFEGIKHFACDSDHTYLKIKIW